jgi:dihydrofolate reductase
MRCTGARAVATSFSTRSPAKRRSSQDIVLYGHGPFGQALLEANLLDELKLCIPPVVVGSGTLLFREGKKSELKLVVTDSPE